MTSSQVRRVAVVAVVLIVGALFFFTGFLDALRDQERVEDVLDGDGVWGELLYIAGFTALQPLSLPGALLIIPATFVWSAPKVFGLTMVGGIIASTIGFGLARRLGRDWVDRKLPARFRPWQQRMAERQLLSVIGLRTLTGLAPAADWLLGVSPVSWRNFFIGTAIGLVPMTFAMAVWGDDAARVLDRAPWLLAPAAVAAVIWAVRKRES